MSFQVYQAQGLRIYTGDTATVNQYVGLAGELAITTDNKSVRILDGINPGGTPLTTANGAELQGLNIEQLANLLVSAPQDGQALVYEGGKWKNKDVAASGSGGASHVNDLVDVKLTNLQTGEVLSYNASIMKWENKAVAAADHNHDSKYQLKGNYLRDTSNLGEVNDVQITMPADGQSLVYDAGYQKWINTTLAGGSGGNSGGFNSSAVVGVQQVIKTEPFSTTSAVPVDIPEMSITVTPKSKNSKFRIECNLHLSSSAYIAHVLLKREDSLLHHPTNAGTRFLASASCQLVGTAGYEFETPSIDCIDSPDTTEPVTYKLQLARHQSDTSCTAYINRGPADRDLMSHDIRGVSTITVTEILESSATPTEITDPANGETLVYEDGKWVNSTAYSELDTDASRGATTNADNSELPAFACRAFCTFDGTDFTTVNGESHCKILCSGNISKVVRHSTGWYRVHFKTSMPDNNYSPSVTGTGSGTTGGYAVLDSQDFGGAGSNNLHQGWFNIRAVAFGSTANLYTDHPRISIQVFR